MTPPKPICKTCNGSEWVCEWHPDKPWGDHPRSGPNGCHCGGAGKPCPECNELSKRVRQPNDAEFASIKERAKRLGIIED